MNEAMKAYGVFLEKEWGDTLIYSDALSYAIYENWDVADVFKMEMEDRFPSAKYCLKEMGIEVKMNE